MEGSKSGLIFDLIVKAYHEDSCASVQISHYHTNIVKIAKNEEVVYHTQPCDDVVITSYSIHYTKLYEV